MTQENKELLLKDLCARLPYGVKVNISASRPDLYDNFVKSVNDATINSIDLNIEKCRFKEFWWDTYIVNVRPYLRPMKSMTKGEKEEYRKLCKKVVRKLYVADGKSWPSNKTSYRYFGTKTEYYDTYQSIDYLISRHFDYRGLIGKKLALKATKGMYK